MDTLTKWQAWSIYYKAIKKKLKIERSRSITYMVAGGGIEREYDLMQARKVSERLFNYWNNKSALL